MNIDFQAMNFEPPLKPGDAANSGHGAVPTNSVEEAFLFTYSYTLNTCSHPCKVKEDVKKFLGALSAKITTVASWVTQLDGPCSSV